MQKYLPGLSVDVRYATKNNFTGKKLYKQARVFALYPVARALREIRAELLPQHLDIKIYDAYRPYTISLQLWDVYQDDRYVATPQKGSRHNRGCALDMTLIDTRTGKELDMPTPFDSFSNKAHDNYNKLPAKVLKNRAMLRTIMEKHGFTHLNSEWWHFDFLHWGTRPILDISFEQLDSLEVPIKK
ncbi:MAG: M15 family metallopeptidase [Ignavibacteria bacterium]|nr:M15 family metallopeptidase [Ignavibacteria bacterium]